MIVDTSNPQKVAEAAVWVLSTHKLAVVATADPTGAPWAVPVNRAYDFEGRFMWKSDKSARHSQNLAVNPRASVTLFSADPTDGDAALFLEGTVEMIEDEVDLENAIKSRYEQAGKPVPPISNFQYGAPDRVYRLKPTAAWITEKTHTKTPVDLKLFESALG